MPQGFILWMTPIPTLDGVTYSSQFLESPLGEIGARTKQIGQRGQGLQRFPRQHCSDAILYPARVKEVHEFGHSTEVSSPTSQAIMNLRHPCVEGQGH